MNYLFLVFAKHPNQNELVKIISNDIAVVSKFDSNIKYYYGSESIIFTFESSDEVSSLNEFFHLLYGELDMVFMLLPYNTDNMSVKIDPDIYKHLFGTDKDTLKSQQIIENDVEAQRLYTEFQEKFGAEFIESLECDEKDEISKMKKVAKKPSLDDLLDKINESGISSLTKKELNLLNTFSK